MSVGLFKVRSSRALRRTNGLSYEWFDNLSTNCRISSQFVPVESPPRGVALLTTNGRAAPDENENALMPPNECGRIDERWGEAALGAALPKEMSKASSLANPKKLSQKVVRQAHHEWIRSPRPLFRSLSKDGVCQFRPI